MDNRTEQLKRLAQADSTAAPAYIRALMRTGNEPDLQEAVRFLSDADLEVFVTGRLGFIFQVEQGRRKTLTEVRVGVRVRYSNTRARAKFADTRDRVPVGTEGMLKWIGMGQGNWPTPLVLVELEDGRKFFTNPKNVEASEHWRVIDARLLGTQRNWSSFDKPLRDDRVTVWAIDREFTGNVIWVGPCRSAPETWRLGVRNRQGTEFVSGAHVRSINGKKTRQAPQEAAC